MTVAALILGAGRGERFVKSGGSDAVPKALTPLGGRSLLAHSLTALAAVRLVERLQPVLPEAQLADWDALAAEIGPLPGLVAPVAGGPQRRDSVARGLRALPGTVRHVVVHDAARPLLQADDAARVIAAALEHGAALLATPVRDTLHRVREGRIVKTLARADCWAAQTPQVFRRDWLEAALARAPADGGGDDGGDGRDASGDEAGLLARDGHPVQVVPGRSDNWKITSGEDLQLAERWLQAAGPLRVGMRIGQGFDAHRFAPGRPLRLGGVTIPNDEGLVGHSDGDVLLHAVCDALLGAAGEGDLGLHFPSSDPAWRGADSAALLTQSYARVRRAGLQLGNLDATVIAERPRLAPQQAAMRARIAEIFEAPLSRINIKLKSSDGLGALGRGEGIAAQALVLLIEASPGRASPARRGFAPPQP